MVLRLLFYYVILLLSCCSARSQDYIFNRLTTKDGLLSNRILSIWQDSTGYLWLGTESGLQRYDGNLFRTMLNERVDQVLADGFNRVWIRSGIKIGTFDLHALSFSSVSYESIDAGQGVARLKLGKDASGRVFLVTEGKSCQYLDETGSRFSKKNNPFLLPDSVRVTGIVDDKEGERYWVLATNGLGYWDKKSNAYFSTTHNPQENLLLKSQRFKGAVSNFFIDDSHRYWIQAPEKSGMRFFCFDVNRNQFTHDTTGLSNAGNGSYFEVNGFSQYNDSVVAVYGLNCLRINEGEGFHELRDPRINPYGIHFNTVNALFEDRERLLWIATDDGLYNTKGTLARNIHVIFSNPSFRGLVNSIAEDDQQRLWIGAWSRGVFVMNTRQGTYPEVKPVDALKFPDPWANRVVSMCADPKSGRLWIGCEQGRLLTYDLPDQKAALYQPRVFNDHTVRQVINDNDGRLWFGLDNGDIILYDQSPGSITEASFRQIYSFNAPVTKMIFNGGHQIWVAISGKGIFVLDADAGKIIGSYPANNNSSGLAAVQDMLPLSDSSVLIASDQLLLLNRRTGVAAFLPSVDHTSLGRPLTLQKDAKGDCWIGSSNGIFKYNPEIQTLTKYSQQDGLITVHNNSYIPEISMRLTDDRLVFGGNQHLLVFDPRDYRSTQPPPDVTITGFQLNNRYIPADSLKNLKRLKIPYSRSAFTIEFASISFLDAGKMTYEYKLEGLEDRWTTMKTAAPVKYNFLPPGNYRFLVRAKNDEGLYSSATTEIVLRIVPPFWRTPWFYLLLGALVACLLYYLHRLRLQRLLHVEKVRSRLARDLHDDMGSTLSTINILSNMALQQKALDEKTSRGYMQTINSSTGQMMEAMDDIVWSINPGNDNMAKILTRMKETAGAVLEPIQVDYQFDVDESAMSLHFSMESRREIFLIFKEAVNNIAKYANCNSVVFTLQKRGSTLLLVIEDDGKGFDLNAGRSSVRGNGLRNMKKRAENIKGTLSIDSAPGRGTRLGLSIPLA